MVDGMGKNTKMDKTFDQINIKVMMSKVALNYGTKKSASCD